MVESCHGESTITGTHNTTLNADMATLSGPPSVSLIYVDLLSHFRRGQFSCLWLNVLQCLELCLPVSFVVHRYNVHGNVILLMRVQSYDFNSHSRKHSPEMEQV